ncbi:MAG TPA: hypothetical protein VM452_14765, partial [Caulifigura sp.]|nr:hypothetical protein [Caulifigura sp.]
MAGRYRSVFFKWSRSLTTSAEAGKFRQSWRSSGELDGKKRRLSEQFPAQTGVHGRRHAGLKATD